MIIDQGGARPTCSELVEAVGFGRRGFLVNFYVYGCSIVGEKGASSGRCIVPAGFISALSSAENDSF